VKSKNRLGGSEKPQGRFTVAQGYRLLATRLSAALFCIDSVPHPFASFRAKGWETSKAKGRFRRSATKPGAPGLDSETGDSTPSISHKSQKYQFMRSATWLPAAGIWPHHPVSIPCPILSPLFRRKGGKPQKPKGDSSGQRQSRVPPVSILRPGIETMAHDETYGPRSGTILQQKQCKTPLSRSF